MSLTEILEEVVKLTPAEKEQVRAALNRNASIPTIEERQEQLLQEMLAKGLLRSIPDRKKVNRDFRPITIKGKPLSETIIEDRG